MNKYCVYLHKRKDNGNVFYVGEGTLLRPYSKGSRNKKWHEIVNSIGYEISIVKSKLSKTEALELESSLIKNYQNLVNSKVHSKKVINLDYDLLNKWFYIDNSSPTGLRWKMDKIGNSPVNRKYKFDIAGTLLNRPNGKPSCWQVSLFNKRYMVHRIIWILNNKKINNEFVIDHIDRNPLNNKLDNLREVSYAVNSNNASLRYDSKTGVRGVQLSNMGGVKYYTATWYENNKQLRKNFRIDKLGCDNAFKLAVEYRKDKQNDE